MYEESTRLQDIRQERLRDLQTRHLQELAEFDAQASMAKSLGSDSPRQVRSTSARSSVSLSSSGSFNSRNGDAYDRDSKASSGSGPVRI